MKAIQERKALTLGALIESGYRAAGEGQAKGILSLAAKARLIVFQGPYHPGRGSRSGGDRTVRLETVT